MTSDNASKPTIREHVDHAVRRDPRTTYRLTRGDEKSSYIFRGRDKIYPPSPAGATRWLKREAAKSGVPGNMAVPAFVILADYLGDELSAHALVPLLVQTPRFESCEEISGREIDDWLKGVLGE